MFIPTSMGTQHPDSASQYVPIQEEADEAVAALTPRPEGLGLEEFMIDFEGKMTPYHQTADIAHRLLAKGLTPGREVWLTPRVSSATEETVFRQLMALMSIIEADYDIMRGAEKGGGIHEVILPMVKGADDLIAFRRRIADIMDLAHKEFGMDRDPNSLQVIPLVEDVPYMLSFAVFYRRYHEECLRLGFRNDRLRFMMARSDSALVYGMVASALSVKMMISDTAYLADDLGLPCAPILGGGCLPFRGHVRPENLPYLLEDFSGVRTVTIQSGLRYDLGPEAAMEAARILKEKLPAGSPKRFNPEEVVFIRDVLARFAAEYMSVFKQAATLAANLADIIPRQRDRLTMRGPAGYARRAPDPKELIQITADVELAKRLQTIPMPDELAIPRAITYTAALYTVGLPPEFLGIGRGLRSLVKSYGRAGVDRLLDIYPGLVRDMAFARRFLSPKVAGRFFGAEYIDGLRAELEETEKLLDVELLDCQEQAYETLLEIIEPLVRQAIKGETFGDEDRALLRSCTVRLGKMRGSLG